MLLPYTFTYFVDFFSIMLTPARLPANYSVTRSVSKSVCMSANELAPKQTNIQHVSHQTSQPTSHQASEKKTITNDPKKLGSQSANQPAHQPKSQKASQLTIKPATQQLSIFIIKSFSLILMRTLSSGLNTLA